MVVPLLTRLSTLAHPYRERLSGNCLNRDHPPEHGRRHPSSLQQRSHPAVRCENVPLESVCLCRRRARLRSSHVSGLGGSISVLKSEGVESLQLPRSSLNNSRG